MNTSQIMAMLNKQLAKKQQEIDEMKANYEELEEKYGFECECNIELYETQQINERLGTLLYNAITCLEEEQIFDTHERLLSYLGMTEKEYIRIMGVL